MKLLDKIKWFAPRAYKLLKESKYTKNHPIPNRFTKKK